MEKNKIKLFFLIIILIFVLLILTGCAKKKSIDDIKHYIENDIGIKDYQLSDTPTEKKENDNYTDYYWHVKYKSIEFDVIEDNHYSLEWVETRLCTDFDQKVIDYFYSNYKNSNMITYKKDNIYNKNTLICEVADDKKIIDENKLKENYENIVEFIKTIDFNEYPIENISVEITNKNEHVKWLTIYSNKHIYSFSEFKNS